MNIASHALRDIKLPPPGLSKRARNPKKAALSMMEEHADLVEGLIRKGVPASKICIEVGISVTSFWLHVDKVMPKASVVQLRINGKSLK